jgi:adenosylmethionine-8-amino-7-oxononanoate aminotransferase
MPSAFLHPFAKPTSDAFTTIVRGDGARVWDASGRELIDGMASLWYAAIGHGRVEMADTLARQARTLGAYSTFDPFTNEPAEALAARLAALAPMADSRIFFTSSGSEAVDSAMKLARIAHAQRGEPERVRILSRDRGYHGVTYGGMSAQGLPLNKQGFGPLLPGVDQVGADDIEAVSRYLAEHGNEVAAVLVEPVQGAGGVFPPTPGYLAELRRLCDRHGAFLIFDEVICAFGRLGTWFGAQYFDVEPDLITFAKAVTSGYIPLGGVVVGPAVRAGLEADPAFFLRHGFTYSGHPTACAAAMTNLDIIEREGLLERAPVIGARLGAGLRAIAAEGQVAEARGEVAVWAVGLRPDQDAALIRNAMLERGAITRAIGANTNSFCPPLVISDAEIDHLLDALDHCTR